MFVFNVLNHDICRNKLAFQIESLYQLGVRRHWLHNTPFEIPGIQ